jgi:hypothetical protein
MPSSLWRVSRSLRGLGCASLEGYIEDEELLMGENECERIDGFTTDDVGWTKALSGRTATFILCVRVWGWRLARLLCEAARYGYIYEALARV